MSIEVSPFFLDEELIDLVKANSHKLTYNNWEDVLPAVHTVNNVRVLIQQVSLYLFKDHYVFFEIRSEYGNTLDTKTPREVRFHLRLNGMNIILSKKSKIYNEIVDLFIDKLKQGISSDSNFKLSTLKRDSEDLNSQVLRIVSKNMDWGVNKKTYLDLSYVKVQRLSYTATLYKRSVANNFAGDAWNIVLNKSVDSFSNMLNDYKKGLVLKEML